MSALASCRSTLSIRHRRSRHDHADCWSRPGCAHRPSRRRNRGCARWRPDEMTTPVSTSSRSRGAYPAPMARRPGNTGRPRCCHQRTARRPVAEDTTSWRGGHPKPGPGRGRCRTACPGRRPDQHGLHDRAGASGGRGVIPDRRAAACPGRPSGSQPRRTATDRIVGRSRKNLVRSLHRRRALRDACQHRHPRAPRWPGPDRRAGFRPLGPAGQPGGRGL